MRVFAAILGVLMAGSVVYGVSNWIVGLNGGSSGEAQSGSVSDLSIAAAASPTASDLLYPGGSGDVVVTINNPNPFPVTITAVQLPTDTTYASGYTSSSLSANQIGCLASTPSDVIWSFSTDTSGSSHTLTSALTVAASGGANDPLVVTLTNDASMTTSAPAACESTYFSMPSLTGITATAGGTGTSSPTTDSWTS